MRLATISLLVGCMIAGAQPPAPATGPTGQAGPARAEGAAGRLDQYKLEAGRYRIVVGERTARALALVPEPVLHWTNPLRKTDDGAVFLGVADGRPEAVASLYRYRAEGAVAEDHEFQSLATAPLTATRDGRTVWNPGTAGVTFAPIPDAPAPAATAAERLRQMRALAREFKAGFNGPRNKSDLRLLTQPLYRYEPNRPEVTDGALFAFVQTTDPEVLLLIEARRPAAGGPTAWHYAFARMSMVFLRGEHRGNTVWTADWDDRVEDPDKPYVTIRASVRPL
jgi:hypothetical protein